MVRIFTDDLQWQLNHILYIFISIDHTSTIFFCNLLFRGIQEDHSCAKKTTDGSWLVWRHLDTSVHCLIAQGCAPGSQGSQNGYKVFYIRVFPKAKMKIRQFSHSTLRSMEIESFEKVVSKSLDSLPKPPKCWGKKQKLIFTIQSNFKIINFDFIVNSYSFTDIISFVLNHYFYHILLFKGMWF